MCVFYFIFYGQSRIWYSVVCSCCAGLPLALPLLSNKFEWLVGSSSRVSGSRGLGMLMWAGGQISRLTRCHPILGPVVDGYRKTMLKDGKISDFPAFLTGCWGCAWGTPGMRILTWFRSLCAYWRGWQLQKVGFMKAKSGEHRNAPKLAFNKRRWTYRIPYGGW